MRLRGRDDGEEQRQKDEAVVLVQNKEEENCTENLHVFPFPAPRCLRDPGKEDGEAASCLGLCGTWPGFPGDLGRVVAPSPSLAHSSPLPRYQRRRSRDASVMKQKTKESEASYHHQSEK